MLNFGFFWITDHKNIVLSIYSKIYLSKADMDLGIRINGQSKEDQCLKSIKMTILIKTAGQKQIKAQEMGAALFPL